MRGNFAPCHTKADIARHILYKEGEVDSYRWTYTGYECPKCHQVVRNTRTAATIAILKEEGYEFDTYRVPGFSLTTYVLAKRASRA